MDLAGLHLHSDRQIPKSLGAWGSGSEIMIIFSPLVLSPFHPKQASVNMAKQNRSCQSRGRSSFLHPFSLTIALCCGFKASVWDYDAFIAFKAPVAGRRFPSYPALLLCNMRELMAYSSSSSFLYLSRYWWSNYLCHSVTVHHRCCGPIGCQISEEVDPGLKASRVLTQDGPKTASRPMQLLFPWTACQWRRFINNGFMRRGCMDYRGSSDITQRAEVINQQALRRPGKDWVGQL